MRDESQIKTGAPNPSPTASNKKKGSLLVTIIVGLCAFWYGWNGGKVKSQDDPEQWVDKSLAPRLAVLRQQLSAIEARPMNTVNDYISNTLETSPIVDEGKGLIAKQIVMIARFKFRHTDNATDVKAADYWLHLTEKDSQLMDLLSDEVQCAKDLKAVPVAKRMGYYNATVLPIKDKESQVVKDWYAVLKDARANGVPLPANIDQPTPQQTSSK
jgi:hypothetical protein